MQTRQKQLVQMVLFVGLSALVTYLAFRGADFKSIWAEMTQARLDVLVVAMLVSALGQFLRAWRWKDLLNQEQPVPLMVAYHSLMTGYLVNFGLPRVGEVTRCALVTRRTGVKFATVLGTVVTERMIDVLALGVLVTVTVMTAGKELNAALNLHVWGPAWQIIQGKAVWMLVAGVVLLLAVVGALLLLRSNQKRPIPQRIWQWVMQGWRGVLALRTVRSPIRFLLLTIGIWVCYWSGPLCTLWAMGILDENWLGLSFAMFTMGSIARTIPLPAGSTGAYHFIVGHVLMAFGFDPVTALATATLNHATQTGFYLITGGISAFRVSFWK